MTPEMLEKVRRVAVACGWLVGDRHRTTLLTITATFEDLLGWSLDFEGSCLDDDTLRLFLARVYTVLRERGKWEGFYWAWCRPHRCDVQGECCAPDMAYDFLHDLAGQVEAALAVLEVPNG